MPPHTHTYTPQSALRNPSQLAQDMLRDALASRYLAWRLLRRDLSARFRRTALGFLWLFLPPAVMTATFAILQSQRVLKLDDTQVPYPLFAMTGALLWNTFRGALLAPLRIVNDARSFLSKVNLPHEALLLTAIATVLIESLVRCLLLLPLYAYYALPIPTSLPLALATGGLLLALGTALGALLTPLGLLYRDVGLALTPALTVLMLLTPVFYTAPPNSWLSLNPLTPPIAAARDWATTGAHPHLLPLLLCALATLGLFALGWLVFRLSLPILLERLHG